MEEEQLIFEEQEVVWAKIRGYPWWPAFVNQVHQDSSNDIDYTVVFFGDNTNSRLDGTKLRKFLENYVECYSKAKTHRKLMMSIMMAEDKLRQNDQNVEIFEQLRNRVKNKRGKTAPKDAVQSSQHMSEKSSFKNKKKPKQNQIYQQPEDEEKQPSPKQVKTKEKNTKQKTKSPKRTRRRVDLDEKSIKEQEAQSEIVQLQGGGLNVEKAKRETQIKQKHQQYMKKAIVSIRTYDISIEVKNGTIVDRKLSQNIILKQEENNLNEQNEQKEKQLEDKQQNNKKQLQNEQALNNKNIQQEVKGKKDNKGRKRGRQKSVIPNNPTVQPMEVQPSHQNIINKLANETKNVKKPKQILLPSLQKHPTQPLPAKQQSQMQEQVSEQINNQESQSLSSQFVKVKRRGRSVSTGQNVSSINRPIVFPRKRGRPKKIDTIRPIDEDNDSQKQEKNESLQHLKKKPIHKMPFTKQVQKPKAKSLADQAVINGVKKLLQNRKALIEFLLQSTINVDNVKEILDMDVSTILQEGLITDQVMHLLQLFRTTLLYKFFPDDIKHRKKYQKLIKKKNFQIQRQEIQEKNEELPETRKKTINSIKQYLALPNEEQSKVLQIAQSIQQLIYEKDQELGSHYGRVAFKVISALKNKKQQYTEIMLNLQANRSYQ